MRNAIYLRRVPSLLVAGYGDQWSQGEHDTGGEGDNAQYSGSDSPVVAKTGVADAAKKAEQEDTGYATSRVNEPAPAPKPAAPKPTAPAAPAAPIATAPAMSESGIVKWAKEHKETLITIGFVLGGVGVAFAGAKIVALAL